MPLLSRILSARNSKNIERAAKILNQGGIVAFPTETVYGLGANALEPKAVVKIFEIKKRPFFDPLIVHAASAEQAFNLCREIPDSARTLADKFWPGPLTLVLPKKKIVPDLVTSGLSTVAVRVPAHPVALKLIRLANVPVAAPSANRFGRTSPTTALHVWNDLGPSVGMILDGGASVVGVESTVLKIEGRRAYVLRPGGVSCEMIRKTVPALTVSLKYLPSRWLESPGLLKSHYAPGKPLFLIRGNFERWAQALETTSRIRVKKNKKWPKIGALTFGKSLPGVWAGAHENLSPKGSLREAAANLFQAMRKLDKMKVDLIVAQSVPEAGVGLAVMDRLRKASGGKNERDFRNAYSR